MIVFDGSFGHINCTRSMAEDLIKKAPLVQKKVMEEYYPYYLKQRGMIPQRSSRDIRKNRNTMVRE